MSFNKPDPPGISARFAGSRPGAWLVSLSGEHDTNSRARVTSLLTELSADGYDIVVDLSAVTFMDASIIGALQCGRGAALDHAATLRVRGPSAIAHKLLVICDMASIIEPAAACSSHDSVSGLL